MFEKWCKAPKSTTTLRDVFHKSTDGRAFYRKKKKGKKDHAEPCLIWTSPMQDAFFIDLLLLGNKTQK